MVAALAVAGLSACTDANGRKITFFSLLEQDPGLTGPSSLPPAGYSSDIWIDNRGCSFVRTGTDTVRWVPQVDSSRKPICDPSLAVDIAPAPQIQSPTTALPGVGTVIDPETGLKTEILPPKQIPPSYVQVGAFADRTNGIATRKRLSLAPASVRRDTAAIDEFPVASIGSTAITRRSFRSPGTLE